MAIFSPIFESKANKPAVVKHEKLMNWCQLSALYKWKARRSHFPGLFLIPKSFFLKKREEDEKRFHKIFILKGGPNASNCQCSSNNVKDHFTHSHFDVNEAGEREHFPRLFAAQSTDIENKPDGVNR